MAGIYFHIPFCKQACDYCNFHFSTSLKNKALMLECMLKELEMRKEELSNVQVHRHLMSLPFPRACRKP